MYTIQTRYEYIEKFFFCYLQGMKNWRNSSEIEKKKIENTFSLVVGRKRVSQVCPGSADYSKWRRWIWIIVCGFFFFHYRLIDLCIFCVCVCVCFRAFFSLSFSFSFSFIVLLRTAGWFLWLYGTFIFYFLRIYAVRHDKYVCAHCKMIKIPRFLSIIFYYFMSLNCYYGRATETVW